MQEMKRQALGKAENDDESSDEEDEGNQELAQSVDNLRVFCVASSDYMKLTQANPDGPPSVRLISIKCVLSRHFFYGTSDCILNSILILLLLLLLVKAVRSTSD